MFLMYVIKEILKLQTLVNAQQPKQEAKECSSCLVSEPHTTNNQPTYRDLEINL